MKLGVNFNRLFIKKDVKNVKTSQKSQEQTTSTENKTQVLLSIHHFFSSFIKFYMFIFSHI